MSDLLELFNIELNNFKQNEHISKGLKDTRNFITKLETLEKELEAEQDEKEYNQIISEANNHHKVWESNLKSNLKNSNSTLNKFNKNILDKIYDFELNDVYIYKIDKTPSNLKLIDNAIKLHLIRNGDLDIIVDKNDDDNGNEVSNEDPRIDLSLLSKFTEMNQILKKIQNRDLSDAIQWATKNENILLTQMGSDLEFNLHKLQYLEYYHSGQIFEAVRYAKTWFPKFINSNSSNLTDVSKLMSSILFNHNDSNSPYHKLNKLSNSNFQEISILFSKKYCSVLGFSFESSIFLILLSGYISFPTFLKFIQIKHLNNKLDWTTHNELPFEINQPDFLKRFHPIFICPVSKEETTLENPPMALPCHHILSKQSLQKLSRNGGSFKCPYCPTTCIPSQCKQVNFGSI
ncbi:hypothetical protein BN7_2833 [Wickerhamomyces ciferrii]|uniref:GID complex catalytic subunit 2 n=1 Tax=Wickerhamomyces ciferrii (strain ATCC 14091 / BCRC 22168 / CBS 111 / JCM 3599 / NBRC 0793 / NRRL Y-1031 F-60-10) TaxID=1206466 RepID=K0KDX9_WICCF|nr:uncharacterized protein BN7_2833 [Wickerhamomyces ciferrii]CCH43285.1 hypothetical protein BN7_2833 [Wickerhamomyces ciferrii]